MRIKFDRIHMINFKKHDEFEVDLNGINLIVGRNGSGKSSIFEAIYTCLYNRRPNGKPAKTAVKKGSKNAILTLDFYIDNDKYTLTRSIGSQNKSVLYLNDEKLTDSSSKIKELIDSLIPSDIMKLAMLYDIDIKQIITKYLLDLSFVDKIKELYKHNFEVLEMLQREEEFRKLKHSQAISKLEELHQNEKQFLISISNLENSINEITNFLNNYNVTPEIIQSIYNYLNSINVEDVLSESISELSIELSNIKNEITKLGYIISTKEHEATNKINEIKQYYDKQIQEIKDFIDSKVQEANNKMLELLPKINEINKELYELADEINRYKSLLHDSICPTCGQPINDEKKKQEIQDKLNQLILEYNEKYRLYETLSKQFSEYEQASKTDMYLPYYDKINELNKEMELKITEINDLYESEINKLINEKDELMQKRAEIERQINKVYSQSQDQVSKQIVLNTAKKFNVDEYVVQHINDFIEKVYNLKSLSDQLIQQKTMLNMTREEISKVKEIEEDTNKSLKEIQEEIENTYELVTRLENLTNTRLWTKVSLNVLKDIINTYLTDDMLNLQVEFELDEKENLVIKVTNLNGEIVSLDDLSQGEKITAKLIIYIAITKIISGEVRISNLFLDEVIDALDAENVVTVLNYLANNTDYDNINVISHNESIKGLDIWDNIIELV